MCKKHCRESVFFSYISTQFFCIGANTLYCFINKWYKLNIKNSEKMKNFPESVQFQGADGTNLQRDLNKGIKEQEMKKKSVLLIMIIVIALIASNAAFSAFAQSENVFEYTVSDNKATITAYSGSAEMLSIPSTLGGYSVCALADGAFQNNLTVSRITVPDSVSSIGARCFYGCVRLKTVILPASVTQIAEKTFANCTALERLTVSGALTHIYRDAFSYCTSLQSFILQPSLNYIGDNAFLSCYSAQINMEGLSSDLTYLGAQAFRNCYSAYGAVNISVNTTVGGLAFDACGVSAINFSIGHSQYSSADGIVFNRYKSTLVCYPAGKTDEEYSIPSSVTQINTYAFHRAQYLEKINIPSSVRILGTYAFASCLKLDNVILPGSIAELPAYCFNACPLLKRITLPENLRAIGAHCFGYCDLREIALPSSLLTIEKYAFYRNYNLKEAELPDSVTTMESYVFEDCKGLMSVTLSSSLAALPFGTFAGCEALSSVSIPEGYTEIEGSSFSGCTALDTVYLPSTLDEIGRNAFQGSGIKDVYFNATEALWNEITINETGNQALQSANIHFPGEHIHSFEITGFNNNFVVFSCSCGESYRYSFSDYINSKTENDLDINDDGIVNAKDYAILIKSYS